mmetsp:Transcript_117353/g.228175  ORF Transcript_117353/g.228175 Transcript_117353/m.228175 type:complete len:260 (+) Transcript_117353:1-780(+)
MELRLAVLVTYSRLRHVFLVTPCVDEKVAVTGLLEVDIDLGLLESSLDLSNIREAVQVMFEGLVMIPIVIAALIIVVFLAIMSIIRIPAVEFRLCLVAAHEKVVRDPCTEASSKIQVSSLEIQRVKPCLHVLVSHTICHDIREAVLPRALDDRDPMLCVGPLETIAEESCGLKRILKRHHLFVVCVRRVHQSSKDFTTVSGSGSATCTGSAGTFSWGVEALVLGSLVAGAAMVAGTLVAGALRSAEADAAEVAGSASLA